MIFELLLTNENGKNPEFYSPSYYLICQKINTAGVIDLTAKYYCFLQNFKPEISFKEYQEKYPQNTWGSYNFYFENYISRPSKEAFIKKFNSEVANVGIN